MGNLTAISFTEGDFTWTHQWEKVQKYSDIGFEICMYSDSPRLELLILIRNQLSFTIE